MCEAIQPVTDTRVFCEFDVREVHINFAKVQGFFIKLLSIECVLILLKFKGSFWFHQRLGGFVKLPSVECVSISLKFRGYFVKLTFMKSGGSFAKFPSMDYGFI